MNNNVRSNQSLWDELTKIHTNDNEIYPIDKFKQGQNVLNEIELKEVGTVKNKKLLHLQCHFGMDTLSWARLGADVTGVDFSKEAITAARQLSSEIGINATFIQSDILEFKDKLNEKFDIVFASYGALYWIRDISKWMEVAASYLKKDGFLYVIDGHPFYHWLNREGNSTEIMSYPYSYFDRSAQISMNTEDYTGNKFNEPLPECGWHYTISDLINSAVNVGLQIDSFNEFPHSTLQLYENAWRHIGLKDNSPILFSLKGTKK